MKLTDKVVVVTGGGNGMTIGSIRRGTSSELTDQDKLVYVNDVLIGKLLESETLRQQAANNSKQQFATSPDLNTELVNAIMSALDAHNTMSTQALNSLDVRRGLKEILLNHAALYERLRESPDRATP